MHFLVVHVFTLLPTCFSPTSFPSQILPLRIHLFFHICRFARQFFDNFFSPFSRREYSAEFLSLLIVSRIFLHLFVPSSRLSLREKRRVLAASARSTSDPRGERRMRSRERERDRERATRK